MTKQLGGSLRHAYGGNAHRPDRHVLPGAGRRIKRRRMALGLTIRDVDAITDRIGHRINWASISRIENERVGANWRTLRILAVALNVNPAWILGLTRDPLPLMGRANPKKQTPRRKA